jgi:UDP-N-acetylmuramyl pentapeptide phosphotransferase/UDP-N-acetylglucosamine-1-phosphate transferase
MNLSSDVAAASLVGGIVVAAMILSWAITGLVLRLFSGARHASTPNDRTMHTQPTPNVGGIAIVLTVLALSLAFLSPTVALRTIGACFGGLALVSLADQYRPVWPLTRLLVQALAVAAALSLVPAEVRLIPAMPFAAERLALGFAWLWVINLTNFIDGIDGIAASGVAMVAAGYVAVVHLPFDGSVDVAQPAVVALVLVGACLGYLVWNWHPARIFMGDSGSIPLGFLMGWLMLDLALRGYWVSALILPAVFVADATLTLLKRVLRGEKIWRPHRTHFYQRAVQGGTSPASVVKRMLIVDVLLVGLAILARTDPVPAALGAIALVALLLFHWSALAPARTDSTRAGSAPR